MTRRVETVRRGDRQVRVHEMVSGCLLVAATSVDRAVVVASIKFKFKLEKKVRKRKEDVQRITCLKEDNG